MCIKWLVVTTLLCATVACADERPNVLWIMADDLRPQLGCYGDDVVKSPHIDPFATRALRFEHAYVQSAICSPSRNSMLSGLRPNTSDLRGFGIKVRDVLPDIVTLPQHFKNHGYEAQAFGKIFHIYDESMLGDEEDAQSWSEPTRWPEVPVWGPEQNAIRDRLITAARQAGKEFKHPHDWPRAKTWDDSDIVARELYDHRNDKSPRQLETQNVISDPMMASVASYLIRRLNQLVPPDVEK